MFREIIAARISQWIAKKKILEEMQNGFRRDRRGVDSLFILTSTIEIARKQRKRLITCFLDYTKAYDQISRDDPWETLEGPGRNGRWIQLLKMLFTDYNVIVKVGDVSSSRIQTRVGLRQGCPLSSILSALFIADLEKRLMETECGFEVTDRTVDDSPTRNCYRPW